MKKIIVISILFVFGLFLGLLPSVGEAKRGEVKTVTCGHKDTLQTHIDSAPENSTILVKGTCNENVVIDETKINITIDGGGSAKICGVNTTKHTVDVKGRGVTIRGLTITGGYNGIEVERGGTALIEGNNIHNTQNNGVTVGQDSHADIINNTIQSNPHNGIEVHDNAAAHIGFVRYSDTVAQPNTIQNNGNNGINIQRTSSASVVGNTIQNNTKNGINVQRDSHADISDNLINGNGNNGINVTDNSGVNSGNNTGSTIFDLPNATTVNNAIYGILCTAGGYADGRLGTLNGVGGAEAFSFSCLNFLN